MLLLVRIACVCLLIPHASVTLSVGNTVCGIGARFRQQGNAPIHYAACRGVLNIIVRLLSSGAETDVANVQGSTPLHKACAFGQNAVVKKLIE